MAPSSPPQSLEEEASLSFYHYLQTPFVIWSE